MARRRSSRPTRVTRLHRRRRRARRGRTRDPDNPPPTTSEDLRRRRVARVSILLYGAMVRDVFDAPATVPDGGRCTAAAGRRRGPIDFARARWPSRAGIKDVVRDDEIRCFFERGMAPASRASRSAGSAPFSRASGASAGGASASSAARDAPHPGAARGADDDAQGRQPEKKARGRSAKMAKIKRRPRDDGRFDVPRERGKTTRGRARGARRSRAPADAAQGPLFRGMHSYRGPPRADAQRGRTRTSRAARRDPPTLDLLVLVLLAGPPRGLRVPEAFLARKAGEVTSFDPAALDTASDSAEGVLKRARRTGTGSRVGDLSEPS